MSLKAELETWASALKAYDEEDFEKSLDLFSVRSYISASQCATDDWYHSELQTRPKSSPTWVLSMRPLESTKPP